MNAETTDVGRARVGCLTTLALIAGALIVFAVLGNTEMVQWDTAIREDTIRAYRLYLKRRPEGVHRPAADAKLRELGKQADTLWSEVVAKPDDSLLHLYLTKYSASESDAVTFFIKIKDVWGHPMESEYIDALRSPDPVRKASYAGYIAAEGKKAILYAPYLIDLLDDNAALQVLSGPAVGPKTKVGTTSVAEYAHYALKKITSQEFGPDKVVWQKWWNEWWETNRGQFR